MITIYAYDFKTWREAARNLLKASIKPEFIIWNDSKQSSLFPEELCVNPLDIEIKVPKNFLNIAKMVSHHRDSQRFSMLYIMLWRLLHENKNLLKISSDPLTYKLEIMKKSVRRDVHKTKAFVRFRKINDEKGDENYIAWHRPDHYSLKLSAPFFRERFAVMKWAIITPDESVYWDLNMLHFGPGGKASDAPKYDAMEDLWREFYRAIFNPARIKIKAMKKEMPVRHWRTLPEAKIIKEILVEAPKRVQEMIKHQEGYAYSATDFIPKNFDLNSLKEASKKCQGCPLYKDTTQTVFGIGPDNADIMFVGEQPGDMEDKDGRPLIGPAGEIFNMALKEAEINREETYITNAVKHFKFTYQNNMRLHRTPNLQDTINCKAWLEAELKIVKPKLVICLGVTASRSLIDTKYTHKFRGEVVKKDNILYFPTYHPSAILRSDTRQEIYNQFVNDLKIARNFVL